MNKYFDQFLSAMVKVSSTKALTALKDGFVLTMPITLIGSLFLLLANLPITGYADFMVNLFGANWNVALNQVSGATFDILAIVSVLGIAYSYAKNEGEDGITSGIMALVAFLIVTASSTVSGSGEVVTGIIPKVWAGGQGVITAIIIGLLSGFVFTFLIKKKITIQMPAGVPQGVANAFTALIPGFIIIAGAAIIYQGFFLFDTTLTEFIFSGLQIPLQNLSDTFVGGLVIVLLISLLFWAGIHGPNIVMGVMAPILTANALANSELAAQGMNTLASGARIVTPQVIDNFVKIGGTGITVGLLIAALLAAKSKQMKQISKLSIVPGIFNINEPVIYGLPIVYNPLMLVPFIIVPVLAYILTYVATATGFIVPFIGVQVPWTMPPILSGFILSGLNGALLQIAILVMSVVIYYPFMMKQDQAFLNDEVE
ncbi:MAG: PTS sugar transporter subunit IIC [Erysipelotrichaceae bacterium]